MAALMTASIEVHEQVLTLALEREQATRREYEANDGLIWRTNDEQIRDGIASPAGKRRTDRSSGALPRACQRTDCPRTSALPTQRQRSVDRRRRRPAQSRLADQ